MIEQLTFMTLKSLENVLGINVPDLETAKNLYPEVFENASLNEVELVAAMKTKLGLPPQ